MRNYENMDVMFIVTLEVEWVLAELKDVLLLGL
jgi:hypothetical protein